MIRRPPRSTRTDTLFPYTTLFRSLVLQRAPQPLDKDVVEKAAAPIHRDAHAGILQALRPGPGGELAALVGVEDFWATIALDRLVKRLDAEPGVQGVGEAPGQHLAAPPVHDRHQDRKSTRLNSSHYCASRMPFS